MILGQIYVTYDLISLNLFEWEQEETIKIKLKCFGKGYEGKQ